MTPFFNIFNFIFLHEIFFEVFIENYLGHKDWILNYLIVNYSYNL